MPSQEDIAHQQTLLNTHRQNLKHYLQQQAAIGTAYAPPVINHGIAEARTNIKRIKRILREWQVFVENLPDDGDETDDSSVDPQPKPSAATIDRVKLWQTLVNAFNEEELREITFYMNIDYESLAGTNKPAKARELVTFVERRNRLTELVETAKRLRSDLPL